MYAQLTENMHQHISQTRRISLGHMQAVVIAALDTTVFGQMDTSSESKLFFSGYKTLEFYSPILIFQLLN